MKKKAIPALIAVALVTAGGIGYYAGQQQSKPVADDIEQLSQAESNLIDTSGNEKNSTINDAVTNNVQEETPEIQFIEVTEEMKLAKFEEIYNAFIDRDDLGDQRIFHEMVELNKFYESCGYTGKAIYAARPEYKAWRESYHFDGWVDTGDTVYATTTVNVRSGPSTDDEKLGQLAIGQEVFRISINDDTGWSLIELIDGSEVYVRSDYLSNTKPAVKGNASITSNTTPKPNNGESQEKYTNSNNQNIVSAELSGLIRQGDQISEDIVEVGGTIDYEDYDPDWNIGG